MQQDKNLIKKSIMVGIGNITGLGLAFLFMTVLALWMSQEEYGKIRYILSVVSLLTTLVAIGLPSAMTRFLAKYYNQDIERNSYFSNIIFIFLISLLITEFFTAVLFPQDPMILIVLLGYSVPLIYFGITRGLMEYIKFSIFRILRNLIKLLFLAIVFLCFGLTKISVLLIYSFSGWIVIFFLEIIWKSNIKFNIKFLSKNKIKNIIYYSIPVFITTLAYSVIMQTPLIFLKYFGDYQNVAIYSLALTLSLVYGFVPGAILTVSMPKIASLKDLRRRLNIFIQSIYIIIISGILLLIPTIFFGQWVIVLIFKERYSLSYLPFVILSIGAIFAGIRNAYSSLWEGGGRPIFSAYDTIGGAASAILFSAILVPRYGAIGAALSYSGGWVSSVLISSYFLLRLKKGHIRLE